MARSFDSCGIVSAWKVFNLMLMSSGILILTCALYSVSFSCSAVIKSKPGSVLLQKRQYFPGRNEFFETNSNYVSTDDVAREKPDMSSPATALKFESSDVRYIHENGAKPRVQNPNSLLDGSDSKYATEDTRNIAQIGDSTYELFENRQYRETTESASPVYSNNQISPGLVRTRFGGIRKLPSAIIIGVKKGGTRALLEFLRIHPDVRAPGPEIHFFDRHYDLGLDWYRRRMPSTLPGQVTMEKTPCYFVTKDAPKRISAMSKAVKLIIVVRDPVTRAISDYTQTASKRPSQKPFEAMAFLNNSTIVDASWGAIRIGMYAKHIERWLRHFQLEQMHFVSGERLISDPAGVMADVQDFLGLKRIINEKHFYFNETKGFPCLKKGEGNATPHCLGKTKGRQHPAIDPKAMKRLRDFFRPFNQKFYQTVNKDFGWP